MRKKGKSKIPKRNDKGINLKQTGEPVVCFVSKSEYVELQAKAYYLALKQMEDEKREAEKLETQKKNQQREKKNFLKIFLRFLNVLCCPWKIFGKRAIDDQVYDSILVIPISALLLVSGSALWSAGVGIIFFMLKKIYFTFNLNTITFSFFLIVMGSFMILSGKAFSEEKDSMKIYAYSASVIALISCVVSIITLIFTIMSKY